MSITKNSKVAKATSAFVGFTTALMMVGGTAVLPASAATIDELLAQIAALTAQINSLSGSASTGTNLSGVNFARNLQLGNTGEDVRNLQKVLNVKAETRVAASGAGSPGSETTYFGPATKSAVIKFQNFYASEILAPLGLTSGTGLVGASTRAKLNAIASASTGPVVTNPNTPTTPTSGTGLTISSAVQPLAGIAPQGASRVPFTKVTLTAGNDGDVTVNGFTIERGGPASDAIFSGVVVLDQNGIQIGIDKTFNSDHRLVVGDPVIIPRGTSKTFTIAGNMNSSLATFAGQVAVLSVVDVNTTATVTGTRPITGAAQTVNASLTIGTAQATTSSFDPDSALTKEIGTTGIRFAGIRLQAGSAEKVRLWSIRWNQTGSVGSGDLANLVTVVDGTSYPMTVSSDGKYYTAVFGSGIVMDKGFSKDLYVQGDIVGSGASARTVQFDLYKATDVYLSGETFGYGINVTAGESTGSVTTSSEFTTGTPFFSGSVTTVSAGSVTTIVKSATVPSQNIAVNVPNQPLGGYDIDIKGEAITVQNTIFTIATSSGTGTGLLLLTNVSLMDKNGAIVAGPVDAVDGTIGDGNQTVTFTDTITYPVGMGTYTLVGRLPSGTGNGQQLVVSTNPTTWSNIRGLTSGNNLTLTNGSFSMNTMTVKAASLTISVSSSPVAQNIAAGGTRDFANYQLDATQSGEDVRFSSIPLKLTFQTGSAAASRLTNCQIWDGTTALNTGSNVVNPSGATGSDQTFTLDQQLTVTKGTVKTLKLRCTVSGSAGNGEQYSFGIQASPSIAVTGVVSGNGVTEVVSASNGQFQTVSTSGFTVTLDSSTPAYTVAAGGQTGVTLGSLKFRASTEAVNLQRLALQMSNSSASSSPINLSQVRLYDGATLVGTAQFTGTSRFATSTLTLVNPQGLLLPKDQDKVITIKGDLAEISQTGNGTEGALIQVDYDGTDSTGTQGSGLESGSLINTGSSSDTAVAGVRVYRSYPVFTYSTTGATANNGANDLLVLNVAAPSNGDVQLYKLTFSVGTTTATLTSPTFNGPNGSVGATSLNGLGTLITVTFDSVSNTQDRLIAAGQSKSYTLRGTVALTGNSGSTGSVQVALKSDAQHGNAGLTGLMGNTTDLAASNIIWSPNATGTSAIAANDWANAYGLPGCYLTSGLAQDCQSRTIAK